MTQPFRLAVYNEAKKLLGYWWLREHDGGYAVTCRHPITREFELFTSSDVGEVLAHFFSSYLFYLQALVRQLDAAISDMPDDECRRPGFRPDHFRRMRRELISRRAIVICRSRERYAEAITTLRQRGWAITAPPPCFPVDISHAARSLA